MNQAVEKPFYLKDNFGPVAQETSADHPEVRGTIPAALNGRLLRNGPNPQTGWSDHWFFGNGMVHGVEFENGKANWYRNRYVKTTLLADPEADSVEALMELDKSAANTHVVAHAGKILALEEAHLPWEISPELDTVGLCDFDGKLALPMTAHPKICPTTGEMLFFGYGLFPPFLTYHRVNAAGELIQSEEITVPKGTMMHDFNITENYVIWMDLPAVWDIESATGGGLPINWDLSYGARLGVMPRTGSDSDVVWYDIDPCYVFHPLNAYEEGDNIVLDVCRKVSVMQDDVEAPAHLTRWVIDRNAGTVSETQIDDRSIEFPRICPSVVGLKYRYGYAAGLAESAPYGERYIKYDMSDFSSKTVELGEGREGSEAVFVKNPDGNSEDDGWLMAYVYDNATDSSEILILDALTMSSEPVARVLLPARVPMGFHGSWVPF
ncbi:MAG: carotenoid cleavage dioxygenase-like enzyme [Bacteroidia bacterium]|jgi:carotenoid cleavage dioxygenase-like enzyme